MLDLQFIRVSPPKKVCLLHLKLKISNSAWISTALSCFANLGGLGMTPKSVPALLIQNYYCTTWHINVDHFAIFVFSFFLWRFSLTGYI